MTEGRVEIVCDDQDDLIALDEWLRRERDLRGAVRLRQGELRPGDMGGVFDAVQVAVASGGAASLLVTSLFTWLGQRTKAATLRLKLTRPDGARVDLVLDGVKNADEVADQVISFMTRP